VHRARHVTGDPGQDQRVHVGGLAVFFPVGKQGRRCRLGPDGRAFDQRQQGVEIGLGRTLEARIHDALPAPSGGLFGGPLRQGARLAANADRRSRGPPAPCIRRRSLRFGSTQRLPREQGCAGARPWRSCGNRPVRLGVTDLSAAAPERFCGNPPHRPTAWPFASTWRASRARARHRDPSRFRRGDCLRLRRATI
jgi:hypothetical protein